MDAAYIRNLLEQQAAGTLSPQQWRELEELINSPEHLATAQEAFIRMIESTDPATPDHARWRPVLKEVFSVDKTGMPKPEQPSVHQLPIRHLQRRWLRYAAAAVLVIATTTTLLVSRHKRSASTTQAVAEITEGKNAQPQPGSARAVLTLSNGKEVVLDTAKEKTITDGDVAIQNAAGRLIYQNGNIAATNTITTPRGGQYQLTLADGTKVWLNAASSIVYPTAFTGQTRTVSITGEVYLEVAKDASKHFMVEISGRPAIEVLGTSFDINSYGDEGSIKTTLVEGSIKVNNEVVLKPGQQAIAAPGRSTKIADANIAQVLAWKNGYFDFDRVRIKQMVLQIERWYDIKVEFQEGVPDMLIRGKMDRAVALSDVIRFLNAYGLKTTLKNRILTVQMNRQ